MKNQQNSLRFKRTWWESLDENHRKEGTTTKGAIWELMVLLGDSLYKCLKCAQVPSESAPTWSTWLNNKYSISNNKIQQQQQQQQQQQGGGEVLASHFQK